MKIISDKLISMKEAIGKYVNDEEMVFLGGFGNGITYSVPKFTIR